MYRSEAVLPEEVKLQSLRMMVEVPACPSKGEEKDLLEPDRLKVVANLHKYQEETRALKNTKVKLQELDIGNLFLLRSPRMESYGKLESKWFRPYLVVVKPRPGAYCFLMIRAGCWSIPGTWKTFAIFFT
jgi:hypothetical protein